MTALTARASRRYLALVSPRLLVPFALLLLLAAGGAAKAARAQEPPPSPPKPQAADDLVAIAERALGAVWYGVYIQERKVGHYGVSLEKVEVAGRATYRSESQSRIDLEVDGQRRAFASRIVLVWDAAAPHRLLSYESESRSGDDPAERIRGFAGPDGFRLAFDTAGHRDAVTVPQPRHDLAQALALPRLLGRRPAPGAESTYIGFDPSASEARKREEEVKVKVLAVEPTVRNGVATRLYAVEEASSTQSVRGRYLEDGTCLEGQVGRIFTIRLEDEETAKDHDAAFDVDALRVKLERPIGRSPERVRRLKVLVQGLPETVAAVSSPRQKVERRGGGHLLTIVTEAEPDAGERLAALTDEARAALRATRAIQSDDPKILALARRIVGDERDPFERAKRLCGWVYRNLEKTLRANQPSALHVLDTRRGDCTEHTLLFVALARAAGVPAREASGLMYSGDDESAFAYHAWPEVWVGRWIAVDPTWNEPVADATHIKLGDAASERGFIEALGSIRIEVVEVE